MNRLPDKTSLGIKRPRPWRVLLPVICAVCATLSSAAAQSVRIKDICAIEGMRENQLVGYGLVVGLNRTGDKRQTGFTMQSLAGFLRKNNIQINPADIDVKNVAAVMVTTELPPFARQGMKIDVIVSSMGDAENLQGGTLIATPLRPVTAKPDDPNQIYAIAQGNISTGGYAVGQGGAGSQASIVKNHPNVALIPNGAIIEREVKTAFSTKPEIQLLLRNPDFTTAVRIADAINATFGTQAAAPLNAGAITVKMPGGGPAERVEFVSRIENLPVVPDSPARVVFNERTGTIVMGGKVRISTTIITHGNLILESLRQTDAAIVQTQNLTQQSAAQIETERAAVGAREEIGEFRVMEEGVTVDEVARGLNALGVSARDIISIFQALKECGALQAELVAM